MTIESLFTIGFTKKSASQFFNLLRTSDVQSVVDTRLNNSGQLSGFAKQEDLRYFLKEILNVNYTHWEESAPEPEILRAYKDRHISWDVYAREYCAMLDRRRIMQSARSFIGNKSCLLCSEALPHQCHRSLLASYLTDKFETPTKVVHLT